MPNPIPPTEIKRPVEIPWEETQALLAKPAGPANGNPGPTKIEPPVQIPMEKALALVARNPQPRAPLFVKSLVTVTVDPMDRRK